MNHSSGAPGTVARPIPPAGPWSRSGAGGAHHLNAHRCYLEFAPVSAALPYVRRHARQTLAGWQLGCIADDAELVVSELVTNAVLATQAAEAVPPGGQLAAVPPGGQLAAVPPAPVGTPVVALYLALERAVLSVLVWDCSPQRPARRDHDQDAPGGRGLVIVQALTDAWGSCATGQGGKVTWARLAVRPAAAERAESPGAEAGRIRRSGSAAQDPPGRPESPASCS